MAKEKVSAQEIEQQAKVGQSISAVEKFFEQNGKAIWICVAVLAVVVLGYLALNKFYMQPRKAEAKAQLFPAEASFRAQQWEVALKGDGNQLGFEQVIEEYGSKAGAAVYLYAGECELQLGNFESAISYLKKYAEALECFEKAAAKADNPFAATYLKKAGIVCEELGQGAKALSFYKAIKDKYPQSIEGYDIDKYISRIETAE